MLVSSLPYKFSTPWAANAASTFVTPVIPATSSGAAASQQLGFPPATSQQAASGGTPPNIADFNGAYQYVTLWTQWQQAGGPVFFDATFASNIGGYPKGAEIMSSAVNGLRWISTADNNTTNPDAGGAANWITIGGVPMTWTAQQTFASSPVLNNNVGVNGKDTSGTVRNLISYQANNVVTVNGGQNGFVINNVANTNNNVVVTDAGNLSTRGSTSVGTTLTVGGAASAVGNITSGGAITANGGRLRASVGALNSGDTNAAVLLGDVGLSVGSQQTSLSLAGVFFIKTGAFSAGVVEPQAVVFDAPFPNQCFGVFPVEGNAVGSWGSNAPTAYGATSVTRFGFSVFGLKWDGAEWQASGGTACTWVAFGR